MYRPKDWDVDKILMSTPHFVNPDSTPAQPSNDKTMIEAGADAMLKALIEQPRNNGANVLRVDELDDGSTFMHNPHRKGWLVFIPEEK